jgi:lipoyl-dependent peroxiredoxin
MAEASRRAAVIWEGDLGHGSGRLELASGATSDLLPVTWASRTERSGDKTSPEELIAAAHATCYAMALANELGEDDHSPGELTVGATCTLDDDDGYHISKVALIVRAKVDGVDQDDFDDAAERAKDNCPVSRALKGNVEITLDATLDASGD